jgi:uncharacterized OsmC-like protein/alpha/beta superfamily hydrolase
MQSTTVYFENDQGQRRHGVLDLAPGLTRAYAIFAHCFACGDSQFAAHEISHALADAGISVLRLDFTGLDDLTDSPSYDNSIRRVSDLRAAAQYLSNQGNAPQLLVGHSFAGTACLMAADELSSVQAIATLGAPANPTHIKHRFQDALATITAQGSATVTLGKTALRLDQAYLAELDDAGDTSIQRLRKPVLILHSPVDSVVDIHEAGVLFGQLKHPKSFISLDHADHLLTTKADARYAAQVIAAWASRYIPLPTRSHCEAHEGHAVTVWETRLGLFQNGVCADGHPLTADEPATMGGDDTGPSPFALVAAGLGACTNMTLRMYANHKGLPLDRVHTEVHATKTAEGHQFSRSIHIDGDLDSTTRARLLAIANRCPVHQMLEAGAHIHSQLRDHED